jgi:hypothetical protein
MFAIGVGEHKGHQRQTLGVHPMLLNEECWFLAVDFDKTTWKEDAAAFRETCREHNVPARYQLESPAV